MAATRRRVSAVAGAILDGVSIDWTSVESSAGLAERPLLDELRLLANLAGFYRGLPHSASDVSSGDRLLPPADAHEGGRGDWGHLRLLDRIGRGAFGDVYRAWDTKLDREVALKLLPASLSGVDARGAAIVDEGRMLARVRHPGVVTIYGADRIGNRIGLWMELVKGQTLQQALARGKTFTAPEAERIGVALCDAVAAVHEAGLLHRDIKPHNVMLAEDGRVVLMDFGTGRELSDSSAAALAGTPLYLAPELLAGGDPAVASDIYSLGVLLFHLLTGSYPVQGGSLEDLRIAHERRMRTDVRSVRPHVPPKLARIVERAIHPEPERRYPSARALGADLQSLEPRVKPLLSAPVLAVAVTLAVAVGALIWTDQVPAPVARTATSSRAAARAVPVTTLPGQKEYPTLSPDGSRVAFMWHRGEGIDIYVKSVNADTTVQLTRSPGGGAFPAWSPDGRFITFLRRLPSRSRSELAEQTGPVADDAGERRDAVLIVPAAGGPERTIWSEPGLIVHSRLDWSPDGEHLVLAAGALGRSRKLLTIAVSSGELRWLTAPPPDSVGDSDPAFSPDGRAIAFVRSSGSEIGLYVLSLAGGEPTRVRSFSSPIRRPAWTADGQSLVFTSHLGASSSSLWRIQTSGGDPEPLPGTGDGARDPSTARSGGRLVFVQSHMDQNLYRADLTEGAAGAITQLAATTRTDTSPDISPDGSRVVFVSNRTGSFEIWVMDASGANPVQLTELKGTLKHPRWSRDGRRIAFAAKAAGATDDDIHLVEMSGGPARRLTSDASNDLVPTWSADSRWIYFVSNRSGSYQIWRVPADGGRAEKVTTGGGVKVWPSSDGRHLYFSTGARAIWRMPIDGGEPTLVFGLPAITAWGGQWVLASDGIYWVNESVWPIAAIELFSFATGTVTRVLTSTTRFDTGGGFSVSPDGRWMVFPLRDYHGSDIMMIESFQ